MKKYNILFTAMLFVVSVIVALLIIEILLRAFLPQQEPIHWFENSDRYGIELKKNFSQKYKYAGYDFVMNVQTNSFGHRYNEYNQAEFHNKKYKKVLLLGDSFMFGQGVNMENHIAYYLATMLNKNKNTFSIINAGVSGWGTQQELTYAKDHFELFQPDIIILLFCKNDPFDDNRFLAKMTHSIKGNIQFPCKLFLHQHSHIYRFLSDLIHPLVDNALLKTKAKTNKKIIQDKKNVRAIIPQQWKRTLKLINDFHNEYLKFNKDGMLLVLSSQPWNQNHREKLRTLDNGENLLFIDLYDETLTLPPEKRRHKFDGHWSNIMHHISAKKLSEKIAP